MGIMINNIFQIDKELKSMYDVSDVMTGFRYWFYKLLNICLDIFDYDGLPSSLPEREIELNLILTGHALIIPDKKGGMFTPISSIFGFDEYYQPINAVFANPVIIDGKTYRIGVDCEIIYNNSLLDSIWYMKADSSLYTFIARYSRMLADIESTIDIYMVNNRTDSYPVSDDQNVVQSIKAFFKKLAIGQRAVITDSSIISKFRNVDINRGSVKDGVNDLLIARDKILEMFYRDLGVKMYQPKKAQVSTDEVASNDQLLLISTDDMLKTRIEGIERVNNMFGTDIRVTLNDKFNVKENGSDERQNDTILSE